MVFKSDKQRKGFFGSRGNPKSNIAPELIGRSKLKIESFKRFKVDTVFKGKRLVDIVTVFKTPKASQRKVLVSSPKLRSEILLDRKELKKL